MRTGAGFRARIIFVRSGLLPFTACDDLAVMLRKILRSLTAKITRTENAGLECDRYNRKDPECPGVLSNTHKVKQSTPDIKIPSQDKPGGYLFNKAPFFAALPTEL